MKRLFAGALCMLFLSVSCGGDDNPLSYDSLAGTYTLEELGITLGGATTTLRPPDATGTLVLTDTGSFTLSLNAPLQGINNAFSSGVYTVDGASIGFTDESGDLNTADVAVSGNRVTLTSGLGAQVVRMVFVKG